MSTCCNPLGAAVQLEKMWTCSFGCVITLSYTCIFVVFTFKGFFKEAESDFRKTLDLNSDFKDAKESLRRTLLDSEEKSNRGYWCALYLDVFTNITVHLYIFN